jgi:hypothetical protein
VEGASQWAEYLVTARGQKQPPARRHAQPRDGAEVAVQVEQQAAALQVPHPHLPEDEWRCQLDPQLVRCPRSGTSSWGCASPLTHALYHCSVLYIKPHLICPPFPPCPPPHAASSFGRAHYTSSASLTFIVPTSSCAVWGLTSASSLDVNSISFCGSG